MAVIILGSIGGGRARVRDHFYHNFKNANQRGRKEITGKENSVSRAVMAVHP